MCDSLACVHISICFHQPSMSVNSSVVAVVWVAVAEAGLSCAEGILTGFRWVCTQFSLVHLVNSTKPY